jgi:hypothetical protein
MARWRLILGAALLLWVLGVAYFQARRRGRRIELALVFLAGAILAFGTAAFAPRPPVSDALAQALVVVSVALLAASMAVVLLRGFRT